MSDEEILSIDLTKIQERGFCFVWCPISKVNTARRWLEKYGYKIINILKWTKVEKLANKFHAIKPSLSSSSELCVMGEVLHDTRLTWTRKVGTKLEAPEIAQGRKPNILYRLIERAYPNCKYLELFGRLHNLREGWCTLGDQL